MDPPDEIVKYYSCGMICEGLNGKRKQDQQMRGTINKWKQDQQKRGTIKIEEEEVKQKKGGGGGKVKKKNNAATIKCGGTLTIKEKEITALWMVRCTNARLDKEKVEGKTNGFRWL